MNVLLLGGGGREHAIAQSISKSKHIDQLTISPGNPGTAQYGNNVELPTFEAIENFAIANDIHMVVVGPEVPLVEGVADVFKKHSHILVVGPSKEGAQLEGSKSFSKKFMQRHHIPTAKYFEVDEKNIRKGIEFLTTLKPPYVLKADGLAAGKGVLIIDNIDEAVDELSSMINGKFGGASKTVVIEEFLSGIEFSVFVLTDGKSYALLPEAKDYKRIGEGDTGLNTGGMGAVSPVHFYNEIMRNKVIDKIIKPTIDGLHKDNLDYKGFVFFGLINVDGEPYVIEYNSRMGDPETEVVFPRLNCDVLELFECLRNGGLENFDVAIHDNVATTVVMVSGGYPEAFEKGKVITIGNVHADTTVFHSGTKMEEKILVTNGGRVLAVTSTAATINESLEKSYASINQIRYYGMYYRTDIGQDLMKK
jgi:phosphoribosylamine---glycine ligase